MALSNLNNRIRNGATDVYVDNLDVGTTNPSARINIYDSEDVLLATVVLGNPAFNASGTTVAGRAEAIGLPISATAVATGDPAYYEPIDRDGNIMWRGQVGSDLTLSSATLTSGETFNLTSFTHTHPTG